MEDSKDFLRWLLHKDELTIEETHWLLRYLDGRIEQARRVDGSQKKMGRERSAGLLEKIHERIQAPRQSLLQWVRVHRVIIILITLLMLVGLLGGYSLGWL